MVKFIRLNSMSYLLLGCVGLSAFSVPAASQETLPWVQNQNDGRYSNEAYNEQRRYDSRYRSAPPYQQAQNAPSPYGTSAPPANRYDYGQRATQPRIYSDRAQRPEYQPPAQTYPQRAPAPRYVKPYRSPQQEPYQRRYGSNEPYNRNYGDNRRYEDNRYHDKPARMPSAHQGTYSENEVIDAGHRFFGSLSKGLAKAVRWAFKNSGRPNGYILGEDAGGAFVAGLRYGEGKLYTKNYRVRRVFWQGPSLGYDFGGDGNRTMTLVYNLRSPRDIYRRFGGVQGAAYLVGGVSVQLLRGSDKITLAPIRTGVGVRLGANIGYLKYTQRPTWNPF